MTAATPKNTPNSTPDSRVLPSVAWSLLSQALSSATNFGVTVVLALVTAPAEFGRYAAVLSVYLLAVTMARAVVTEPALAAGATRPFATRLLVFGLAASLVTVAVGVTVELEPTSVMTVALAVPLLLDQDGLRYRAWIEGDRRRAVDLDAVWLAVSALAVLVVVIVERQVTATAAVSAWVLGGATSALVGRLRSLATSGLSPSFSPGPQARIDDGIDARHRDLGRSQAIMAMAVNLGPVMVAVAISPSAAGAAKALLLPFAAVLSLAAGARMATLPIFERIVGPDDGPGPDAEARGSITALVVAVTMAAVVAAGTCAAIVSALPASSIGPSLARVEPYLGLGVAICVLHVAGQYLADAVVLSGGSGVVVRRLVAVALEWVGLGIGAVSGGVAGLVNGWLIGVGLATAVWIHAWRRPPTACPNDLAPQPSSR
jgi:hypothetical protein